jgi:hypothetical protein
MGNIFILIIIMQSQSNLPDTVMLEDFSYETCMNAKNLLKQIQNQKLNV